jgi:DNA helicase HerA-like ATPase
MSLVIPSDRRKMTKRSPWAAALGRSKAVKSIRFIAVLGGSGSGKTWLAAELVEWFGEKATHLTLDHFYRDLGHLPKPERVKANLRSLAEPSRGLSGGDILNVCMNAIYASSADADPAKWKVTQGLLEREISKVKMAKAEHSGEKGKSRRRIGFQPS